MSLMVPSNKFDASCEVGRYGWRLPRLDNRRLRSCPITRAYEGMDAAKPIHDSLSPEGNYQMDDLIPGYLTRCLKNQESRRH